MTWTRFPLPQTSISYSSVCYSLSAYKRTLHPAVWAMDVIFLRYSCICSGLRSNMNLKKNTIHKLTYYLYAILDCNHASLHTYLVVSTMIIASSANISFTSGVNKWTILQKIYIFNKIIENLEASVSIPSKKLMKDHHYNTKIAGSCTGGQYFNAPTHTPFFRLLIQVITLSPESWTSELSKENNCSLVGKTVTWEKIHHGNQRHVSLIINVQK